MPPLSSPGSSSPIAGDTTALITDPSDEFDVVDTGPPSADDTQNQSTVPEDARSRVWYAIVLCGAGFLFPFNTYIAAADFLEQRYEEYHPEFYITLVYIYATCITVAISLFVLVDRYPLRWRIRFGSVHRQLLRVHSTAVSLS
eukprot:m.181895 g.181895  ORF g.181895 m.181895 type:complete len:143 (-) comp24612_c1_seq1:155-583(-)